MRRIMLPFFVLIAVTAGCSQEQTPGSTSASSPPASAAAQAGAGTGDDKTACATAKAAREGIINDVLMSAMTVNDTDSSATEVTEAADTLKASFTKLGDELGKAAGQAATAKLKETLLAYAAGAKTVVSNVQSAGADRSKLENVTEVAAMNDAEKTLLQLCA